MRFHEIIGPLDEDFLDLGRLPPEKLVKGQPLKPGAAGNFTQVEAHVFHRALSRLQANDLAKANAGLPTKGLHTLTPYGVAKYQTMSCYLGANNSSGFALTGQGELVSVFSTQRSSGSAIVAAAIANGARTLDCFALRQGNAYVGPLFTLYSRAGFRIDTSRNEGTPGQPYAIVRGVSAFVDDAGQVRPEDPRVIVFMRR